MDKYEKALTNKQLEEEKKVLQELKNTYEKAKKEVQQKIADLDARTDMQNLQSIVYQKKYQEAILTQIDEIINLLGSNTYDTVEEYIKDSYINGYAGNMWLLQMQTGCTVCVPIDQKKVQRAMTNDIHLSSKYYKTNPLKGRLVKEDVEALKKSVQSELSAGIVAGKTWKEVAYQVAQGMNSPFKKAMNNAMRIARTEGHRVNQQGFLDACYEAKDKGADIVKQWDSTLDGLTRPWHREADGQIRELNEKFIVDGEEMDAPSIGGSARNVCNCRCQLLQRARWALDEKELQTLKDKAKYFGLDKSDQFEEFKNKYLNLPKNTDNIKVQRNYDNEIAKNLGKDYYDNLQDMLESCENQVVKNVYSSFQDDFLVGNSNHKGGAYHQWGKLYWNSKDDSKDSTLRKKFSVYFHESGHNLDYLLAKKSNLGWMYSDSWNNGKFNKTIVDEVNDWVTRVDKELKNLFKENKTNVEWLKNNGFLSDYSLNGLKNLCDSKGYVLEDLLSGKVKDSDAKWYLPSYSKSHAYASIEKEIRELIASEGGNYKGHALSDILEGATKGKIQAGWGHGKSYWNSRNVCLEAFAEMTEANISGKESLESLTKYLPKSVEVYNEMMKDALQYIK